MLVDRYGEAAVLRGVGYGGQPQVDDVRVSVKEQGCLGLPCPCLALTRLKQHFAPTFYPCYRRLVATSLNPSTASSSPLFEVEAKVVAVLPDFNQVRVQVNDGHLYAVTRHTEGVNVAELQEGQRLLCIVTQHPVRVVHAHLIEAAK